MSIKTGIGIGEAQVFDTNDIVNTFIKQYQYQQKQDQLFAEKIADNLSKFDTNGLTGKDLERATKMYDQLRSANENLSKLNRNERTLLDAQIKKGMNDIKTFSANAKQFYKDRENFGIEYNKDKYSFLPEVQPIVDKLSTLSYGEALDNNLGDVNSLRMKRTPDNTLVDQSLKDMSTLIKSIAEKSKPKSVTQNGITSIYHTVDPKDVDGIVLGILHDDAKKFNWSDLLKKSHPEIQNPTDIDIAKFIKETYEAKNGGANDAYIIKTSEHMAPKPTAGPKPTDSDQFAGAVNGAFSTDPNVRQRALNQLKSHSKTRVADITYNQDGTISLIPMVKNKFTGKYKPANEPIIIESPIDLNNRLGGLGITQSGFGVTTKLNQSAPSSGIITYVTPDGSEYKIPSDKIGAFLKSHPKAKRK